MKIKVPFDVVTNIAHVADIHIRLVKRHDEYREVFSTFYKQLKKKLDDSSIIVVAGDVVHAKTDMSPEMVDLASEFLTSLADIAPTFVIAGNHDLNLSNMDRMDSLSPIIKNIGHQNLHYLKHSGVYEVANVDLAVLSILDDKEDWPAPSDCRKTARKVALFHGPVHGAKTDGKYTINNRDATVTMFDGFDMALLGDIHAYQVLQQKTPTKPIVVYSSSLIQQNHGESLTGHGWCLWNTEKCTHEFIETPNNFGFYTFELTDGKLSLPTDMPKNVRLRLFTGDMDLPNVKKTVATLKKRYNVVELSINKNKFSVGTAAKTTVTNVTNDVTDVTTQNNLIQAWVKKNHKNIDEDMIKRILDINNQTNEQITHDDQSRNVSWKPLKFTFSNMFSYGEGNEIDFENMEGIHGIFAPNASGKSSVVDALIYCLYDKTPRAYKGDHVMNNRKDKFECELKFDINGETFFIRRVGTRKKSGDVKVEVTFWKELKDGSHLSLNGEERRQTNQNIRNYVGSYEDFVLTSLSSQSPTALFIDKSHSERKDLLIQFMGLNIFDKLHDEANEEFKEMTGVLKKYANVNLQEQLATFTQKVDFLRMEYGAANTELENLKSSVKDEYEVVEKLQADLRQLPPIESTKEALENRLRLHKETLERHRLRGLEIKDKLDAFAVQLLDYTKQLPRYDRESLKAASYRLAQAQNRREEVKKTISVKQERVKGLEKNLKMLESYEFNRDCAVCVKNNQSHIVELDKAKMTLSLLNEEIRLAEDELGMLETTLTETMPLANEYTTLLTLDGDIQTNKSKAIQLQAEYDKIDAQYKLVTKEIERVEEQLALIEKNEQDILHNQQVQQKIVEVKNRIKTLDTSIREQTELVKTRYGYYTGHQSTVERIKEQIKELETLEEKYDAYKYYLEATCRDGVPYDLVSSAVPAIEGEINNILTQMVDFTVTLEVDTKNIVGKLNYDHERIWPLENSSGMEKFLTSLAIRVALLNASNLPKSNFMIIDEGMGVLDADNLSSMGNLLNILKTQFDFLVIISHLEASRDMVEKVIEIKREDGYSYINV